MKIRVFIIFILLSAFVLASALVFVGRREKKDASPSEVEEALRVKPDEKSIVVFFSRAGDQFKVGRISKGNTKIVAEMIAEKTGADLFEVTPLVDKYGGTYDALSKIAKKEQDGEVRPQYRDPAPDLSRYDVVFFGSPVWWGDWPMIMYTFFEDNDLVGKKIIPFSTHEGSELARFDYRLAKIYPYSNILAGRAFLGQDVQKERDKVEKSVDEWLRNLGFELKSSDAPEKLEPSDPVDAQPEKTDVVDQKNNDNAAEVRVALAEPSDD